MESIDECFAAREQAERVLIENAKNVLLETLVPENLAVLRNARYWHGWITDNEMSELAIKEFLTVDVDKRYTPNDVERAIGQLVGEKKIVRETRTFSRHDYQHDEDYYHLK
jgi:hypothetical protein